MAFRASNIVPEQALTAGKNLALSIKSQAQARADQFLSDTSADSVINTYLELHSAYNSLNAVKDTPGLSTYAQAQENDGTYDIVAEFNGLLTAIDTAMQSIRNAYPVDANNYLLDRTFDLGSGTFIYRTFTAAQLATVQSNLQAVADAVS